MYIFFNINTGQCIFFLLIFFIINRGQCIFFNTNTGQCILFYLSFLSLIEVNVYFLFIIDLVLILKKYTLTCINDKEINKKNT